MISNVFYKSIAGIAGAGVITTGAYGIYELFNTNTISSKVLKDGLTLLDTKETSDSNTNADDNIWKTKVSTWKEGEGVAKFIEESGLNDEPKKVSALKKKCEKALEEIYEDKKYENFKSYCTKQN